MHIKSFTQFFVCSAGRVTLRLGLWIAIAALIASAIPAGRMDQLVNDLLEYGQLTHLEFPISPLDLKVHLEKVVNELCKEIQVVNAEVRVSEPMPVILGNPVLVEQILSNLLINALNHHELDEKTSYILMNPVRKGLSERAEDWVWVLRPNDRLPPLLG
ncbi:MAG: hypothetical protein H0X66_19775 [Verrucomicrobia bacterium]|nr:hypothetical protein [Verrucomicrobiota bacterium]